MNAILPSTIATTFVREKYGEVEAHKWVDPRSIGSLMLWLCSDAGRDETCALIPFIARQSHPCYIGTVPPIPCRDLGQNRSFH